MRHPRRLENRACGAALGHRFIRFGKVLIGFQSYERQVTWQVRGIVKVLQIGRGWECLWERIGPREIPLQNPHARVYSLKNLACGALKFRSGAFSGLWVFLLALPIGTMAISTDCPAPGRPLCVLPIALPIGNTMAISTDCPAPGRPLCVIPIGLPIGNTMAISTDLSTARPGGLFVYCR